MAHDDLRKHREDLAKSIAVTVAKIGASELSRETLSAMVEELIGYPIAQVHDALMRCGRECRYRLALADVLQRIDAADGRPGADEAWALVPTHEGETTVWTEECSRAAAIANDLIVRGDHIAARMAFRDSYTRLCEEARAERRPVRWSVSMGWDSLARALAIKKAVDAGRLTVDQASKYCPQLAVNDGSLALPLASNPPNEQARQALDELRLFTQRANSDLNNRQRPA